MPQVIACPDAQTLQKIALGDLSLANAEALLEHLTNCSNCAARLGPIAAEDPLVEAVRSQESAPPGAEHATVQRLVQRVRGMMADTQGERADATQDLPPSSANNPTADFSADESDDDGKDEDDGLAPPQAADEIGRLGPYRILKVLGEGGMGKVFLAEDPGLQRQVALKVMKKSLAVNRKSRERFKQEARAAAKVEHDNIIPIYHIGEDRNVPFVAMPLLKGSSLEDVLRRKAPLQVKQTLRIGMQIAAGLAAAHKSNLIHRDIKPANIWIEPTAGGRVKILDFGLARLTESDSGLTQSGAILGTPAYMPPEQARGEKVDHRADLYSLGCVLYRMATGEMPLKGNDAMSILLALATQEPAAPKLVKPDVPPALSDFIMKLLAKDANQRVGSAKEVVQALKAIERGDRAETSAVQPESLQQAPATVPIAKVVAPSESANPFAQLQIDAKDTDELSPVRARLTAPSTGPSRGSARRRPLVLLACTAAFLLLALGGGIIYHFAFQTADGTLLVEVDEGADLRFKKGKLEIRDQAGKVLYTLSPSEKNKKLPPGDYLIDVIGADGLTLSTKEFTLTRNGAKSVRVSVGPVAQKGDKVIAEKKAPATLTPPQYALEFDARKGVVSVNFPSLVLDLLGPRTIEGYVTPDQGECGSPLFVWARNVGEPGLLGIMAARERWSFRFAALDKSGKIVGVEVPGAVPVEPGRKTHVAVVFTGRQFRLFVDGALALTKDTGDFSFDKSLKANFVMGWSFKGLISEVRVSKAARYDKEFTPAKRFEMDADTLALYHFDEGQGKLLKDSSGNAHHGEISGAKWVKADGTPITSADDTAVAWESLFNGKDLTGWKTHPETPGDWRVEEGVLVGRGPKQNLLFSERGDYEDFHFLVECKINKEGNSGQMFRNAFTPRSHSDGYEVQIDNGSHPNRTGTIYKGDKALVAITETLVPPDTWFTQEVIARGNRITVLINGKQVADCVDPDHTWKKGHLALQVFDPPTDVRFRKIAVKKLPPAAGNIVPLFNGKNFDGWEGLLDDYWSIKDGAIVGNTKKGLDFNTFLCSKAKYTDFEMSFQVKLGKGGNSGVQIRSHIHNPQTFAVTGPQCDMGGEYWGSLYGENFGGMMKAAPTELVNKVLKEDDFNDYSIKCVGKHVTIKLNGQTTVDDDFPTLPDSGIIGLQLHGGPPFEVIFRNIQFKDLSKAPTADAWVPLFNGKDLTGWKLDPQKRGDWKVENGLLAGTRGHAYLFSELGDYDDFHVRMKARVNAKGNSGLFFRAPFAMPNGSFPPGYEAQIEDSGHPFPTGSLWPIEKAKKPATIKPDTWFLMEVIAHDNRIIIKVDGETSLDYVDKERRYRSGHLAIQCDDEATIVQVESIEVKRLSPSPGPVPLELIGGSASLDGALGTGDALHDGKRHKLYSISLEKGKTYRIDLMSKDFDTYLYLLGPNGVVVARDDDSGGDTNARIQFQANVSGDYRIVTAAFDSAGSGRFTLRVAEQK